MMNINDLDVLFDKILNLIPCEEAIKRLAQRSAERSVASDVVSALPPGVPQRTPEWYNVRKGMITASEFKIAGAKTLCDSYIWGKIFPQPFPSNAAMQWGCRFEDLAAASYEIENNCKIKEYGLLVHPVDPWLGASPDGITEYGVAIEIKCPFSRKRVEIDKRVQEDRPFPKSDRDNLYARYAPQVQGQLEVCNLDACDFVVAHIDSLDEQTFWQLRRVSDQRHRYAIVVDIRNEETGSLAYLTSSLDLDDAALRSWAEGISKLDTFEAIHYAHVRELGVTRIRRDRECWALLRENLGRTKDVIESIKRGVQVVDTPAGCNVPMFRIDREMDVDTDADTNVVACIASGAHTRTKPSVPTAATKLPSVGAGKRAMSETPLFRDDF